MSQAEVIQLAYDAVMVAMKLTAPILLTSLVIGVVVSIFQAATSIQEMTLTFVPKIIGVALVMVLSGHWMLQELVHYTQGLFEAIPRLVGT